MFETIKSTFIYKNLSKIIKVDKLLLKFLLIVKTSFIFHHTTADASSKTIIMEERELHTMQATDITHFSNQDPKIIKVKRKNQEDQIIVKAQTIGSSKIYIWRKNKAQQQVTFIVTTKKIKVSLERAKRLGLKNSFDSGRFTLFGTINDMEDYKALVEIHNEAPEISLNNVKLKTPIARQVLANLYNSLWNIEEYATFCSYSSIILNCEVWDSPKNIKQLGELLKGIYIVKLITKNDLNPKCLILKLYELSSEKEILLEGINNNLRISLDRPKMIVNNLEYSYSRGTDSFTLIKEITLQFIKNKEYFIDIGETEGRVTSTGLFKKDIDEKFFNGMKIKFNINKDSFFYIMKSKNSFISSKPNERKVFKNQSNSSTKIIPNKETYLVSYRYNRNSSSSSNLLDFVKNISFPNFTPSNSKIFTILKATVEIKQECTNG